MELRRPAPLKKKKLPASRSLPAHSSAIVLDIADFPDPAAPYSQQIGWSLPPSIQAMIFLMTSWRVPSIHLETDPMLSYIASGTGRNAAANESKFRNQTTFSLEQGRHRTSAVGVCDIDVISNELITGNITDNSSFSICIPSILEHRHWL